MTIAATIEKLASRFRTRKTTGQETVEAAARGLAAGETIDTGSVESALVAAGLTLEDFRARVDFHVDRAEKIREFEKLATAHKRTESLDAQISAENAKHEEIVRAYRQRAEELRNQLADATRQVDRSRGARDWLLDPKHAPLPLQEDYVAALDVEQQARERIGDVERSLRDLRERHRSAVGWIEQIHGESLREIHAPEMSVTDKQRQKLSAAQAEKLAEHERRRDRLAREIAEADQELAAAKNELAKAETAVAELQKRILKS